MSGIVMHKTTTDLGAVRAIYIAEMKNFHNLESSFAIEV